MRDLTMWTLFDIFNSEKPDKYNCGYSLKTSFHVK